MSRLFVSIAVAIVSATAFAQPTSVPSSALIAGVPYRSWREAAGIEHRNRSILNPSFVAAVAMAAAHAGADPVRVMEPEYAATLDSECGRDDARAWSLEDLRRSLASGTPVVVSLALTEVAHPLYTAFEIAIRVGKLTSVSLADEGRPRSGALGRLLSLEDLRRVQVELKTNPMTESVVLATRLAIGYDDARAVFVVHDPSFGPALEIPYAAFARMWEATDRRWCVYRSRALEAAPVVSPYRARTPDEEAARLFVDGYAQDAVGNLRVGEARFREALGLSGIAPGYEALLQLELAFNLAAQGNTQAAIAAAERARDLVPEHPITWNLLSQLYARGSLLGLGRASAARERAIALGKDKAALARLAVALPADFMIPYLAGERGWAGEQR